MTLHLFQFQFVPSHFIFVQPSIQFSVSLLQNITIWEILWLSWFNCAYCLLHFFLIWSLRWKSTCRKEMRVSEFTSFMLSRNKSVKFQLQQSAFELYHLTSWMHFFQKTIVWWMMGMKYGKNLRIMNALVFMRTKLAQSKENPTVIRIFGRISGLRIYVDTTEGRNKIVRQILGKNSTIKLEWIRKYINFLKCRICWLERS